MSLESDPFSFRVEFSMACPRCDNPVPVDGPVATAHCVHCQHDLEISEEYWAEHLEDACTNMQDTPHGQGSGSMMFGTNTGNLTLSRFDLYCDNCKTNFEDPWKLLPGSEYTCRECGSRWPVSAPPPWLSAAVPRIRLLVNALVETDSKEEEQPLSGSLTSVSCPSCAGNLAIDGSSRLIRCNYCDKQVYLPDDLWVRIHGTRRKRRWFVVCDYWNSK